MDLWDDVGISRIYTKGEMKLALEYFSSAAEKPHASSAYWSGIMYLEGIGCLIDKKRAKRYLELAADNGHVFAKRDLALASIKGTFGNRRILSGIFSWFHSIFLGFIVALKNPDDIRVK